MLNLDSKNTHYVFDKKGYPVVKGDAKSINDTCGRLVLMGICYGFTPEIIEKLEALLIKHKGRDRIIRHPDNPVISSRDHHSYFFIYRKYTNRHLPDFPKMRGMTLWMESLGYNKKAEKKYYRRAIFSAYIGNWWLKVCRRIGMIEPERNNTWWILKDDYSHGYFVQKFRTPWQNILGKIILNTIPAFALHIKAWQLYVMPASRKKEKLKGILLKRVGKSNIMLRLLFASTETPNSRDSVTQEEIDNYPHMTGYRPGVYLDETCRRDIHEMTPQESEFNAYEKQLILWLYGTK